MNSLRYCDKSQIFKCTTFSIKGILEGRGKGMMEEAVGGGVVLHGHSLLLRTHTGQFKQHAKIQNIIIMKRKNPRGPTHIF